MDIAAYFAPLILRDAQVYFCYRPADQRLLYVSPAYEQVFGGQAANATQELPTWLAQLHPDDRTYLTERLLHAAANGLVADVLLRLLPPTGDLRWLSLTVTSFRPEGEANELLLSGYVRDVTAQQQVMELANRYQAKKDAMLEILSHDLASPLVLVEQMAEYLTEKVEILHDEPLNRMIDNMRKSCQEGVALIRDFVDQEFLESASIDLRLTRIDLAARLGDLLGSYRQRHHAAGHQFSFSASLPAIYAEVDENKFLQVINNLVGNSLKFTPDGGHIGVELSQHPTHILVTVSDNGIGIPTALRAGLFERFTPARRPGLRGEKTTGLGMSIIKTIVELHRGRIWLESEVGKGTTFYIELPQASS